jgi:hypothetical protein
VELELSEQMPLLEWFANNYKNFGEFILFKKVLKFDGTVLSSQVDLASNS